MTITVEMANMPESTDAATAQLGAALFDRPDFVLRSFTPATKNSAASAEYLYTGGGDPNYEMTFTIKWKSDTDGIHASVRLVTVQITADSTTGVVTQLPVDVVIAWNLPPGPIGNDFQLSSMVAQVALLLIGDDASNTNGIGNDSKVIAISRGLIHADTL